MAVGRQKRRYVAWKGKMLWPMAAHLRGKISIKNYMGIFLNTGFSYLRGFLIVRVDHAEVEGTVGALYLHI